MQKILPSIYKSRYYSFLIDDYVKNDIPLISISTSTVPSFFCFQFRNIHQYASFFLVPIQKSRVGNSESLDFNKMSTKWVPGNPGNFAFKSNLPLRVAMWPLDTRRLSIIFYGVFLCFFLNRYQSNFLEISASTELVSSI